VNGYVLFILRSGRASDFQSLLGALGIADTQYISLRYHVERIVEQLAAAGLVECKTDQLMGRRNTTIRLSQSWERIQTALDVSLTELANYRRHASLIVSPFFGKPRKLDATERSDIFVLMPFSKDMAPVYEDHIKNVARSVKLNVKRADDFFTADSVMSDIWSAIYAARLVIADCTGRNPNVFYEIGLAHAVGKPVILITQKSEDVPFDVRHLRYIEYQLTPRGMIEFETKLTETISAITSFDERRSLGPIRRLF